MPWRSELGERNYVEAPLTPFGWNDETSPFLDGHGDRPGRFALRQVDNDTFELLEPFKFYWELNGEELEVART